MAKLGLVCILTNGSRSTYVFGNYASDIEPGDYMLVPGVSEPFQVLEVSFTGTYTYMNLNRYYYGININNATSYFSSDYTFSESLPIYTRNDVETASIMGRYAHGVSSALTRLDASKPGRTWTAQSTPADNYWIAVAYGNGRFVALSTDGNNRCMYSDNGVDWYSSTPSLLNYYCLTYGAGLFVGMDYSGTPITSPDGVNWTTRSATTSAYFQAIAYGNGNFAAVAYGGTGNRVLQSPDGINWTSRAASIDNNWQSVAFGGGTFVAVSDTGTGTRVMTSPDGITWTTRASAGDYSWTSVTYGNGLFVAISSNHVMVSANKGVTWTLHGISFSTSYSRLVYGDGIFVAVAGYAGTNLQVITSKDGINWTVWTTKTNLSWKSLAYGNRMFVCVASNGVGNGVMTSGSQDVAYTVSSNTFLGDIVLGNPTGGRKGPGTLNAKGVYDDNTLLSCYVFDAALDGKIDEEKWHSKATGNLHSPMLRFKSRLGTDEDPLDIDKYAEHWKCKRHLTALPNESFYDPSASKLTSGEWVQRLIETVEIHAVLLEQLNQRAKDGGL